MHIRRGSSPLMIRQMVWREAATHCARSSVSASSSFSARGANQPLGCGDMDVVNLGLHQKNPDLPRHEFEMQARLGNFYL